MSIARRMQVEDGIETGIDFLDTTVIHVEAAVDELLR
jgi:hypothetical protein